MQRIAIYHLETLLCIARLGTFRAAAERLNTTQPAISARVRELETQLGATLFQREGRTMVLNSRGRMLVKECEPLLASLEESLMTAADFKAVQGNVRIGTGEIAAASCLPEFVQAVERDFSGVTLDIELDLTARMMQQLLSGNSDIVFLAGPIAHPGIESEGIGAVELAWVASPATANAMRMGHKLPIWSVPARSPIHGILIDSLKDNAVDYRAISTCNNVRTLIDILLGGNGAALLPSTMVARELADGALVEILPRPARKIRFEAAIRKAEQDPVILALYQRAVTLRVDESVPAHSPG